jgi:LytS/YehU family sensor histidine kinase
MRMRLGERLSFDIEVPPELASSRMPPMMLLPLVDHALVYGLEPSRTSGTLRLRTEVGPSRLRLTITDSGAGFVPGGHDGDLDVLEERLRALYGDEAQLKLERLLEHGTQALLEIPFEVEADRAP